MMERFLHIFSDLKVHFLHGLPPKSNQCTPTAVYQFVTNYTSKFVMQVDANCHLQFEAVYKHGDKFYQHPYTLRENRIRVATNSTSVEHSQQVTYEFSLYLELKHLRDFEMDDLKRYYEAIDKNIDVNEEIHDFHDVYLNLHYMVNGQSFIYRCNNGQPMFLPKLISKPWTSKNTLTRFRYDAENRDGTFQCEMTLRHGNIPHLQSCKMVLCLTTNTIPARMDYHALRWICKLRSKASKPNGSSGRCAGKEKSYCLNHNSGVVVAQVFGPELKFTPQTMRPMGHLNSVRSCFEPEDFRNDLLNCDHKDNDALAVVVIKGTDYPTVMKERRKDRDILRYLPFNELDDLDSNLAISNDKIVKRLKVHKEQTVKQLTLFNENEVGTYSQAHVRLYVAAYDEYDVLLTETLHPPLRNNKAFEQLRIIRIVQPKNDLQANELAYVYCDYDYNRSRSDRELCPYQFELVFTHSLHGMNEKQLLQLFNRPNMCINASYVPNCPCLLQFKVPDNPNFDQQRVFIRLRHTQSKDYNPSAVALNDGVCWTYHADPRSVTNLQLNSMFNEFNDPMRSNQAHLDQSIELHIQPFVEPSLLYDSTLNSNESDEDSDPINRPLHTPDIGLETSARFSFSNICSQQTDH